MNAHGDATARIGWCITERRLGVITGEVGAGKTVAIRTPPTGSLTPPPISILNDANIGTLNGGPTTARRRSVLQV